MKDMTGRRDQLIASLGTTGLFLFGFFGWLGIAFMSLGLALMLLAFLGCLQKAGPLLKRDPLAVLAFLFGIYLVFRVCWSVWEFPESAAVQLSAAQNWLQLWLFLLLTWWLRGDSRRVHWLLGLAGLGLIIRIFLKFDWSQAPELLFGSVRYGFGIAINSFGLYSGTVLLGLLVFVQPIVGQRNGGAWIRGFVWLLGCVVLFQGMMISGSRGAMLAFLAGLLVVAVGRIFIWRKSATRSAYIFAGGAIVLVLLGYANLDKMATIFSQEHQLIPAILRFDLAHIPLNQSDSVPSSIGQRIHLYAFGIEKWWERPIFGWGPGMVKELLDKQPVLNELPHLHNSYIQILTELGLVGAAIFGLAFGVLVRALRHSYQEGTISADLLLFIAAAWTALAVWSLTDTRLVHADERFLLLVLTAVSYTSYFWRQGVPRRESHKVMSN